MTTEVLMNSITLLSYEELQIQTNNDQIQLINAIKKQYIENLKKNNDNIHSHNNNENNNKLIIATMCIQDILRWIQEVGIKSVENNEILLNELNELKSMQSHSSSEQDEYRKFCDELEKNNISLKNELTEYEENIKHLRQKYNSLLTEHEDCKNENRELIQKVQELKTKSTQIENESQKYKFDIKNLIENYTYLQSQNENIIKQNNITMTKLHDKHQQELIKMEARLKIVLLNKMKKKHQINII